jgi:poly-gamma-glutamate capsule biosynthesis protein CapA/YwtB (metallophosphatase superfamily)
MARILLVKTSVLWLLPALLWSQDSLSSENIEKNATLIFAGDLNFAEHFEYAQKKGEFDPFENWSCIGEYDLMMVNLENAVTSSDDSVRKEFVFKMKPEFLSYFKNVSISIVTCANNHTGDFKVRGIIETIEHLDSAGIRHVGIGKNLIEASQPVIESVQGIHIGFLGYAEIGTFIASDTRPGRMPVRKNSIIEDIRTLRDKVDFIVVNLHWGEELALFPGEKQIKLAHSLVDAGADVIVGHHPHVLQGIEVYKDKVIAYSMGNFIFGGNNKSADSETAVLKAVFTKTKMDIHPIPVRIHSWQAECADNNSAKRVTDRLVSRSGIFKNTIKLLQNNGD